MAGPEIQMNPKWRRLALQQLESLQRAGVAQLPRRSKVTAPLPSTETAAAPDSLVHVPAPPEAPAKMAPVPSEPTPTRAEIPAAPHSNVALPQEASMAKRTSAPSANQSLDLIRQDVVACRRCEHLACARTQTVFGIGSHRPRLCFFGEAPGAEEDRTGEPFVGRAGQLLTDIIEKGMKLSRSDVYILNVLKCRPPENRAPTDDEIENCREFFERQFEVLKPEFICCLGATATKALLGPFQSLGRMRGKWFDYRGSKVMVTYHPSYLLRNPAAKKDTWEDIQMLMREMGLSVGSK